MPITIDIPPAMVQEIHDYEQSTGQTIDSLFVDFVRQQLDRERDRAQWRKRFDELVKECAKNLPGSEPYKFNRADAYEETLA